MSTPALPIGPAQHAPEYVPQAQAARAIPEVWQPSFGILPNAVLTGSVLVQNAFYNPLLAWANNMAMPLPPTNLPQNQYIGYLPGLSRAPAL